MSPDRRERAIGALAAELLVELARRRRQLASAGAPVPGIEESAAALVEERAGLLSGDSRTRLVHRMVRDSVGLGPLEALLADREVEELMVNGDGTVYVERRGRVEPVPGAAVEEAALRDTIERILAPIGRRVDELSPMVDARLSDGSRVNVIIPPLAVDGPALSIRRFTLDRPDLDRLVSMGTLGPEQAEQLRDAVVGRRSILVSGGTGSGKTTLLNAISAAISDRERIVTIEDSAELRLAKPHVVRLESRPANIEGKGEVGIRDLLRNALRMRPDRIVIGEVRGPEALDLMSALNTGHEGALSTVHANSPLDALRRLETLVLMAGVGLPHEVIAEQLRRGLDLIVHTERLPDGRRVVSELTEVREAAERVPAGGSGA